MEDRSKPKQIAVLVSGVGSNLEAILNAGLPVRVVVADRDCPGLQIARTAGVRAVLIDRRDYGYHNNAAWDREGFTVAIAEVLARSKVDLIAMAGFMTILSPSIFKLFEQRILNTHPALLPKFKGANAVAQTLAAGADESGCTVHIATSELDSGRILAQAKVPVLTGDTEKSLQERIKIAERELYPQAISKYLRDLSPK